jgi:hypothetical protein
MFNTTASLGQPHLREQYSERPSDPPILTDDLAHVRWRDGHLEDHARLGGNGFDMHLIWVIHQREYYPKSLSEAFPGIELAQHNGLQVPANLI